MHGGGRWSSAVAVRQVPSWSPNPTDLYFWYLFVDDQHRNKNMKNKDHLVGQLTTTYPHNSINTYMYVDKHTFQASDKDALARQNT